jgi:Arc/MetJ-type ribon-helix-helix transcriptional regulator
MPSRTVRARLDEASELALRILVQQGRTESEAVRTALVEAAEARRRRSALRAEIQAAAADPEERRLAAELLAEMESISPPWPPA